MKNRGVFLDRDGVLCAEVDYMRSPGQLKLLPGTGEALRLLKENDVRLIVTTNQSGVAHGYFTEKEVREVNKKMIQELCKYGVVLDRIYYCPHHPEGRGRYGKECTCRKPKPGMLIKGAKELNIDLAASYMIGDKESDILAGINAGCKTILVLTGYGVTELAKLRAEDSPKPDFVAMDLSEAAKIILEERKLRA